MFWATIGFARTSLAELTMLLHDSYQVERGSMPHKTTFTVLLPLFGLLLTLHINDQLSLLLIFDLVLWMDQYIP